MPRSLPPEILDLIVDHLSNEPAALRACCVVSKPWFPRTRKRLFARIQFDTQKSHVELWKKTFPNPSNSPAYYARSLSIRGILTVTAADVDVGGWIHTFDRVVNLCLDTFGCDDRQVSLLPLHGLSHTLKSLTMSYTSIPPSEVFGLICSFPLLEDLALLSCGDGSDTDGWDAPSVSPKLTGSLDLRSLGSVRSVARQLCDLPDGLHFNKISVGCLNEDVESTMDLVSKCSDTLESIRVSFYLTGPSGIPSLDLSKVTKLKDVEFRCGKPNIQWVTMTLQTIESENLQRITIDLYATLTSPVGETVHREWLDLDQLLAQFSTSHSIRPKIMHGKLEEGTNLRNLAPILLPELTRRGAVDVVDRIQ